MNSEENQNFLKARIPTILALSVLVLSTILGVLLVAGRQILNSRASVSFAPENLGVANLTDNSATIFWRTQTPATGFITAGTSKSLGLTFKDDRDNGAPLPHNVHYVTLGNLAANTTYYYKIDSGPGTFPNDFLIFQTPGKIQPQDNQPVIGTVVDADNQPVDEAIATLNIPGAQKMAALIKKGNFIIPLAGLRSSNLSAGLDLTTVSINATIEIFDTLRDSLVTIHPPFDHLVLPPLTLGKNLDIIPQVASPSPSESSPSGELKKFDLNHDGVVNSLDRSLVIKNLGKKGKNLPADFDNDGIVDQKDVDAITNFIANSSL